MSKKHSARKMPWESPLQWSGLALSLCLSLVLLYTMPSGDDKEVMSISTATHSSEKSTTDSSLTKNGLPSIPSEKMADSYTSAKTRPTSEKSALDAHSSPRERNTSMDKTSNEEKKSSSGKKMSRKKKDISHLSFAERILDRIYSLSDLFGMVALAAFLGSLMEARRWHLIFGYFLGGFARFMKLPTIVSVAMPTALYSSVAANSMLVSGKEEGRLSHSSLIAGGMANSFLTYLSHSLRVAYPVIGALGLTGFLYFFGQFSLGFLFIMGVLFWHRTRSKKHPEWTNSSLEERAPQAFPWKKAFSLGGKRVARLMFRMLMLTVPIIILVEYLMKQGIFSFWESHAPEWVQKVFPSELMGIVLAQLGGLIQSASVGAELRDQGLVSNPQILLAMFIGSIIGNPIRTLRRNLPSALGIFHAKDAVTIVFGMQLSRFVCTFILIVLTSLYIHYTH